jgi:hypothetical protein
MLTVHLNIIPVCQECFVRALYKSNDGQPAQMDGLVVLHNARAE